MPQNIGSRFIDETRFESLAPSDQSRGLPPPPLEAPWDSSAETIDLPRRERIGVGKVNLTEAIHRRISVREFSSAALALDELCYLLLCTQGVRRVVPGSATFRPVPSAGARHAMETYLLVNRVKKLTAGLYRYLAIERKLLKLAEGAELAARLTDACLGQDFVGASAVTFIWAADVYRMTWRYGQRGYRYLLLDAGHVCQNLYLAAEAVDAGVCAIGAYDDDKVNALVGLDGKDQFAIYLAAVGKRR